MSMIEGVSQDVDRLIAEADAAAPPHEKLPPREWARKNLFNNWYNTLISVTVAAAIAWLAWQAVSWLLGADFEIIRANLRLFMIGQFPKDELWRPWVSGYLIVAAVGFTSGALAHNAYENAVEKGLPADRPTWPQLIRRFWAIIAVLILFTSFARTPLPYIGMAGVFVLVVVSRELGWRLPSAVRARAVFIGAALTLASMVVLAGTGMGTSVVTGRPDMARLTFGLLAAIWTNWELARRDLRGGFSARTIRVVLPLLAGVAAYLVVAAIPLEGYGWDAWGGLHLTLFVTVIGITVGMPFGILLALGRRSNLPILRGASVGFIEFVRGVPLISLLLFSNLMLLLFFPLGMEIPGELTRAMIVITGFSAAYIAEIVRGGLQSVPTGQIEAAQASGLSPGAVQRLVVLPQALRNVIPAMVGQFIALFKDTSLLAIISLLDFLRISDIANAQPEFLGQQLTTVTYPFIALGYWAFAYTMSKESRRLEQKLGVGTR